MLIQCVACGKAVSQQASACPSCGHPVGASIAAGAVQPKSYAGTWLLYLIVISVVLIIGFAWYKR